MKNTKIQKDGTFICKCHLFCVILQRKMNRALVAKKVLQYLAHAEGICLSGGVNTGHIDKRRLTRFVLASRNLVNSSPKTLQHKMPIGM